EKIRNPASPNPVDLRRRDFLFRCCQGASAALIPAGLFSGGLHSAGLALPSHYAFDKGLSSSEYHLHPHYRMPRPLDALLLKTQAGLDDFVTEQYADQIAAILAQWSSGLLQSPQDLGAIGKVLLPNFSGASPQPADSRVVRPGPPIEIRHNTFRTETTLGRDAFLHELHSAMSAFSNVLTAEFQVTGI